MEKEWLMWRIEDEEEVPVDRRCILFDLLCVCVCVALAFTLCKLIQPHLFEFSRTMSRNIWKFEINVSQLTCSTIIF